MLKRLREIRSNQSGFTLIELLIVVVILGVLSGIVVFAVSAFNNDGVTAACKADKKNVEIAAEAYYARTSKYVDVEVAADPLQGLVDAKYLKEKPATGKYTIGFDATHNVTANLVGGGAC